MISPPCLGILKLDEAEACCGFVEPVVRWAVFIGRTSHDTAVNDVAIALEKLRDLLRTSVSAKP
jgi:hypothetical protein